MAFIETEIEVANARIAILKKQLELERNNFPEYDKEVNRLLGKIATLEAALKIAQEHLNGCTESDSLDVYNAVCDALDKV